MQVLMELGRVQVLEWKKRIICKQIVGGTAKRHKLIDRSKRG